MTSQRRLPARDLPEVPYFTLDLHERSDADAIEVLITGDVDDLTVGHLDDSLRLVVDRMPQRQVIVDVSGVRRLAPCGVTTLVRVRRELGEDRRTLTLRGAGARVDGLLDAAGLLGPVGVRNPDD
jgi:anti-anti-sigma factor